MGEEREYEAENGECSKVRDRAYYRQMRHRAISRKKAISRHVYGMDWYKKDGQYSKGKIHCGCGICKYDKKYGIPTVQTEREMSYFKLCMEDYEKEEG